MYILMIHNIKALLVISVQCIIKSSGELQVRWQPKSGVPKHHGGRIEDDPIIRIVDRGGLAQQKSIIELNREQLRG